MTDAGEFRHVSGDLDLANVRVAHEFVTNHEVFGDRFTESRDGLGFGRPPCDQQPGSPGTETL